MKAFAIDLYLWHEASDSWLLVPAATSNLTWELKFTVAEIITMQAGISFRVDHVLSLGNERDLFPLELLCYELNHTLQAAATVNLPVSQYLKLSIQRDRRGEILISRLNSRPATDYFEAVAQAVGSYYQDFQVPGELWHQAVVDTLQGLARLVAQLADAGQAELDGFSQWLLNQFPPAEEPV